MTTVPWAFSTPTPGGPTRPNVPDALGEEAGRELARLTAPALDLDRTAFPGSLPPCDDCAFLEGTEPNRCLSTVADAIKCVVEQQPFWCHKGVVDDKPKRLCAGWVAAVGEEP